MSRLSDIGERGIVARLLKLFDPDGIHGLGDDTAILDNGEEYLLITTDTICQRTHIPENASPRDIGWYSAAINLSDIAAMGGRPLGMLFSLGLPASTPEKWLDELAGGIHDCASKFMAPVLGGDTKENDTITITGIALGTVPKSRILRRSGARPGDLVAMTGQLGRGLLWEHDRENNVSQFLRVEPQLDTGQILAESGAVTSCIDISDGLSTSLHLLQCASNIGLNIEYDSIDFVPGLNSAERMQALHYGGDFELLFTIRPDMVDKIQNLADIRLIGHVSDNPSVILAMNGMDQALPDMGYEHFRRKT
jgi:thiamine-monophosphate kinase